MRLLLIHLPVLFVFIIMLVAFFAERRTKNAGWVDVGWALSIVYLAGATALFNHGAPLRRTVIFCLALIWSLRLMTHILSRLLSGQAEDSRYQVMRQALGPASGGKYFLLFMGEGFLAILLAYPFCVISRNAFPVFTGLEFLGIAIALIGIMGETIADRQLKGFIADAANRGRVCDTGLWRYSRHPNYFFEFMFWVGLAVFAWPSPGGQWAWFSALIMLVLLVKVTGIPHAERQALISRGEAYRQYMQTTSAFFPWFRRTS
jgi:steroid 5-alpha reductase family enzyme